MEDQAHHSQCILVIDGEVLVRHAIADYLRHCGFVVIEASSTDEAAVVLGESAVAVDAILCDLGAPGSSNAFELQKWARKLRKDVQIALAGNVDSAAQKAAELCEQGPQLSRPYDPQSVVEYIRRILGSARSSKVGAAG